MDSFTILLNAIFLVSSIFIPITNSKSSTTPKNIQFFSHDIRSGNHPTIVPIVSPNKSSTTFFGNLAMVDALLTVGSDPNSTQVGRAQGMLEGADSQNVAFLMVMNFVFTNESEYNGSTLSMMGRNEVAAAVREMAIVGGTRVFRYARGFADVKTNWSNTTNGDSINYYNITVLLY